MPVSSEGDGKTAPNLDALSDSERAVLELLARGHTAKSIASLTGQSESAVNERLRSARRKSGVGSSRELARIFDLQKNWSREIGSEPDDAAPAGTGRPPGKGWTRLTLAQGVLLMALAAAAVAVAVFLQPPSQPSAQSPAGPPNDPMVASVMATSGPPNLWELHAKVRAETRDEAWASSAETALRDIYARPGAKHGAKQTIRATCGSTLCEVAGTMQGDAASVNPVMQELQEPGLIDAARPLGLTEKSIAFGGDRRQTTFVAYLSRRPG